MRGAKPGASAFATTASAAIRSRTTTSPPRAPELPPMSDPERREGNPLAQQVDELIKQGRGHAGPSDLPVLTEIVEEAHGPRATVDRAAIEALAQELERAVLARLGPEV